MTFLSWWPRKSKSVAAQKKVEEFKDGLFKVANESSRNTRQASIELHKKKEDIALYIFLATNQERNRHG